MDKFGLPLLNKDIPMPECQPPKVEGDNHMYFITVFEDFDNAKPWDFISRSCGYYTEFNKAVDALKNNKYDIHETCYEYAVIEEIGEGIYPNCLNRGFFKWDKTESGYVAIDEPECIKNISNFSIG